MRLHRRQFVRVRLFGKAYENSLAHELRKSGLRVEQQRGIEFRYDRIVVGAYSADLLVDGSALVELKAAKALDDIPWAQCLNYLKPTGLKIRLLINFGVPRIKVKRLVNRL